MSEINKQMKKGLLEILVLKLLSLKDMYGYELISFLDINSNGMFKMKEGTLYPILYRLEDEGNIKNYREESKERRAVPRKYYKITKKGLENLKSLQNQWHSLTYMVNNFIELEVLEDE